MLPCASLQVPISSSGTPSTLLQLAVAESGALLPGGTAAKAAGVQAGGAAAGASRLAGHSKGDISVLGLGDATGMQIRTGALGAGAARAEPGPQGMPDEDMADAGAWLNGWVGGERG